MRVALSLLLLLTNGAHAEDAGRWMGGFQQRFSRATLDDPAPDAAQRVGAGVTLQLLALVKANEHLAAGAQVGLSFESHGRSEARNSGDVVYFDPGVVARGDIGYFAALGWLGYSVGSRSVGRSAFTQHSVIVAGPRVGAAVVVRIVIRGLSLELGPFAELGRFTALDDEEDTDFNEDGMVMRNTKLGLVIQFWGGAPPAEW